MHSGIIRARDTPPCLCDTTGRKMRSQSPNIRRAACRLSATATRRARLDPSGGRYGPTCGDLLGPRGRGRWFALGPLSTHSGNSRSVCFRPKADVGVGRSGRRRPGPCGIAVGETAGLVAVWLNRVKQTGYCLAHAFPVSSRAFIRNAALEAIVLEGLLADDCQGRVIRIVRVMEKHPHCSPKGGDLRLKIDDAVCQFFVHVVRDTDKGSSRPAELKCCTCYCCRSGSRQSRSGLRGFRHALHCRR